MSSLYNNIPDELKSYKQFGCWRLVEGTGIFYDPNTGSLLDAHNPVELRTFNEAANAVQANIGYEGIAFALSKEDPFVCISFMDTQGDEALKQHQLSLYNQCNSYSERGLMPDTANILIRGLVPNGNLNQKTNVFSHNHLVALTGNVCNPQPIRECQHILQSLWEGYTPSKIAETRDYAQKNREELDEVIANAAEHGRMMRENLLKKLDTDEYVNYYILHMAAVRKVIREFALFEFKRIAKYQVPEALHKARIVPLGYLQKRLASLKPFNRNVYRTAEMHQTFELMIRRDDIAVVPKEYLRREFGYHGIAYFIRNKMIVLGEQVY